MAFKSIGYLPPYICSQMFVGTSGTDYGDGTARPFGYSITDLMALFWMVDSISADSSFSVFDGIEVCTYSASGTVPRNPVTQMSDLICTDATHTLGYGYGVAADYTGDSELCGPVCPTNNGFNLIVNFFSIATDISISSNSDWDSAVFYPGVEFTFNCPDDPSPLFWYDTEINMYTGTSPAGTFMFNGLTCNIYGPGSGLVGSATTTFTLPAT